MMIGVSVGATVVGGASVGGIPVGVAHSVPHPPGQSPGQKYTSFS